MSYCTTALEIIYNDYINKPFIHSQIFITSYTRLFCHPHIWLTTFLDLFVLVLFSGYFFFRKRRPRKLSKAFFDISQFTQFVDKSFCWPKVFRWAFVCKTINHDFITCVSQKCDHTNLCSRNHTKANIEKLSKSTTWKLSAMQTAILCSRSVKWSQLPTFSLSFHSLMSSSPSSTLLLLAVIYLHISSS